MDQHLLLLTTFPDRDSAMACAQQLIREKLAACVNVLPPMISVYEWDDNIQKGEELLLLVKTTKTQYPHIEAKLREIHPYELPEIIAAPIILGAPDYLDWIKTQTAAPPIPHA